MKALILSGGVAHPYGATSSKIVEILSRTGIRSEVCEGLDVLASIRFEEFELLVLNCVRWSCDQTPQWRDDWHYLMPDENREGIIKHLKSGRGILALHAATICFDDWPEYRKIIGAWWEWGTSGHAPYGMYEMKVVREHPIVEGIRDFRIEDELYTNPQLVGAISPLITAEWNCEEHPILWTREYGGGRICYCALGHDEDSFDNINLQKIIQRASLWVTGRSRGEKPSPGG